MHVIDCATYEPGRDPLTDLDIIEAELAAHGGLEDRPRLVALNKIDVPDAARAGRDRRGRTCEARGLQVFAISTKTGEGLQALTFAMAELVAAPPGRRRPHGAAEADRDPARAGRRPGRSSPSARRATARAASSGASAARSPSAGSRQTDFSNPEAVGYLADRFARLGIEEELLRAGRARRGRGRDRRRTTRWCSTSPRRSRSAPRSCPAAARTSAWSRERPAAAAPPRDGRRVPRGEGRRARGRAGADGDRLGRGSERRRG